MDGEKDGKWMNIAGLFFDVRIIVSLYIPNKLNQIVLS